MYKFGLVILAVFASSIAFVNAESESKTLTDCVAVLINNSIDKFSPSTILTFNRNESLSTVDFKDLEMIHFMSQYCDFYHERTGEWIDANTTFNIELVAEYITKNWDTIFKSKLGSIK